MSWELNNGWSIVPISPFGKHAPPIVTRDVKQLKYGLCLFYKLTMLHLLSWELYNTWSMVFVSSIGYHANLVVMSFNNRLNIDSVSSMGNHAPHVVMKVEQNLEYGLCL